MQRGPESFTDGINKRYAMELVDDLKSTYPTALWIGSGPATELGYLDWQSVLKKLLAQCRVQTGASQADINKIDEMIERRDFPRAADFCEQILGERQFQSVLTRIFSVVEKKESLRIFEDFLNIPFAAYVTTNFNTTLSNVANNLFGKKGSISIHNSVFPNLDIRELIRADPNRVLIWYIHSNITRVDQIILTERRYNEVYRGQNPTLREFLETLFRTYNVVFVGTELPDWDLEKILYETVQSQPVSTPTHRYIFLRYNEKEGVPATDIFARNYGMKIIWFPRIEIPAIGYDYRKLYDYIQELRLLKPRNILLRAQGQTIGAEDDKSEDFL